jgi:hypothetical protein
MGVSTVDQTRLKSPGVDALGVPEAKEVVNAFDGPASAHVHSSVDLAHLSFDHAGGALRRPALRDDVGRDVAQHGRGLLAVFKSIAERLVGRRAFRGGAPDSLPELPDALLALLVLRPVEQQEVVERVTQVPLAHPTAPSRWRGARSAVAPSRPAR